MKNNKKRYMMACAIMRKMFETHFPTTGWTTADKKVEVCVLENLSDENAAKALEHGKVFYEQRTFHSGREDFNSLILTGKDFLLFNEQEYGFIGIKANASEKAQFYPVTMNTGFVTGTKVASLEATKDSLQALWLEDVLLFSPEGENSWTMVLRTPVPPYCYNRKDRHARWARILSSVKGSGLNIQFSKIV